MPNRGINGGLDGIISLTEETIPAAAGTIVFNAKVNSYTGNLAARPIIRTGPGSGGIPKIRLADIRGGGSADGEFTWNGPPLPSTIQYATGSITYQLDDGCTITFAVKVSSVAFSHVEAGKGQDELFHCAFKWELVGAVTVAWANGTPVTVSAPGANDSPTYEGRAKSLDPQGIKSTATTRTDCEGVTDDDVTQTAKIAALIGAASAPMPNLKPISISCTQYEDDHNGIQVVTQFALQNSKDEIETPRNVITTDPNDITSETMLAKVFTNGSPPSDPSPPTNQKIVQEIDTKINDQLSFRLYRWGLKDSVDEQVLPRESITGDDGNLQDAQVIAVVWTLGSPPSDPATPHGADGTALVLVSKRDEYITPASTTSKMVRIWTFGRNNSVDDITRSIRHGSFSTFDANTLDGSARVTVVALTASPPSTPSAPISGVKFTELTTRPVTAFYSIYAFEYSPADSKDRLQFNRIELDQSAIPTQSEAEVPVVDGTPSAPSSLSTGILIAKETRQLPNGHVLTTGKYNLRGTHQTQTQNDGSEVSGGPTISDSYEKQIKFVECLATDTDSSLWTAYSAVYTGTVSGQGFPLRALRVRKYTPTCAIVTLIYQSPGFFVHQENGAKVRMRGNIGPIKAKSWLGMNGTTPTIHLHSVLSRGTGQYVSQLAQYEVEAVGGPLVVSQRFTGSAPPLGASSFLKTNSSTFLGYPAQSCRYLGADYQIVVLNGGGSVFDID